MLVTLLPIVRDLRKEQFSKALYPMVFESMVAELR
jgi:hypothetical protein